MLCFTWVVSLSPFRDEARLHSVFVDSKTPILNVVGTIKGRAAKQGWGMKNIWNCAIVVFLTVGCAPNNPQVENKALAPGSMEEKRAVAEMTRLAVEHGYRPEKMERQIKANPETGDFSIFMFPKTAGGKGIYREQGLFALVNAQSGQVIRFSDPKTDPK
jgi:hypothetical protein